MSKLYFTIAPARSGKSTFAQRWLKELANTNRVVVNSDNVRLAMYNQRYLRLMEPYVHAVTETMVRAHLLAGCEVLCDETNCSVGSIRKWLSIDPEGEAIFIDTPKEVCYARARETNQLDLIDKGVIDRHFKNLIDLSFFGLQKENEANRLLPNGPSRMIFFERPDRDYIYKAVEYLREEIKASLAAG